MISIHSGTRITNLSKTTAIYVTFGLIDSVAPSSPDKQPLPKDSTEVSATLALTPLLPEKTLVFNPQYPVSTPASNTGGLEVPRDCVLKMYVWTVPTSQPVDQAKLIWQGYVITCVGKPIAINPDDRTVTYNGTNVPSLDGDSLIERFQHYQEGTCMKSGGMWLWILAGVLILIVLLACVLSPS